jgi:hypothetical protein
LIINCFEVYWGCLLNFIQLNTKSLEKLKIFYHLKEVPADNRDSTYLWQNVPPGRVYSVTVAARNWDGEGPAASTTVSTPEEPEGRILSVLFF